MTKSKNPLFSGEASFNEEAPANLALMNIELESAPKSGEPVQHSLYSKSRKSGFDLDKLKGKVRKMFEDDQKFVVGRFMFHECPGGDMEFHIGPWDTIETHVMRDGQVYTVRKFVADHLNKNCITPRYNDTPVEVAPGQKRYVPLVYGNSRCSFSIQEILTA